MRLTLRVRRGSEIAAKILLSVRALEKRKSVQTGLNSPGADVK